MAQSDLSVRLAQPVQQEPMARLARTDRKVRLEQMAPRESREPLVQRGHKGRSD